MDRDNGELVSDWIPFMRCGYKQMRLWTMPLCIWDSLVGDFVCLEVSSIEQDEFLGLKFLLNWRHWYGMFQFVARGVRWQCYTICSSFLSGLKGLVTDKDKWKMITIQVSHAHRKHRKAEKKSVRLFEKINVEIVR